MEQQLIYALLLNTPRVGVQLLGNFSSREKAETFAEEHKTFLHNRIDAVKSEMSVTIEQFRELADAIEEKKVAMLINEQSPEEDWKACLEEAIKSVSFEYNIDSITSDLEKANAVNIFTMMSDFGSYNVYETAVDEAKHQLPHYHSHKEQCKK